MNPFRKCSEVEKQGLEPRGSTPAEFGAFIGSETDKWGKIIRAAGISAD